MADLDWETFLVPVQAEAVRLLASLVGEKLLDAFLAKGLLTQPNYDEILPLLKQSETTNDVIAEKLVQILCQTATPSFRRFCDVLKETEGGNELFKLVLGDLFHDRVPSTPICNDPSLWTCRSCTYGNKQEYQLCEVCGDSRPRELPPPDEKSE